MRSALVSNGQSVKGQTGSRLDGWREGWKSRRRTCGGFQINEPYPNTQYTILPRPGAKSIPMQCEEIVPSMTSAWGDEFQRDRPHGRHVAVEWGKWGSTRYYIGNDKTTSHRWRAYCMLSNLMATYVHMILSKATPRPDQKHSPLSPDRSSPLPPPHRFHLPRPYFHG